MEDCDNKENCENPLPAKNTVDYEIKHRDVHVEDWSIEIGDQTVIDAHLPESKPSIPIRPLSTKSSNRTYSNKTYSRNRNNKRENSRNNKLPDLPHATPNIKSPHLNPHVPSFVPRQQSLNARSHPTRGNYYPPQMQQNSPVQPMQLLTRNPDKNIKVFIPVQLPSSDVRLDTKFSKSGPSKIQRQVFNQPKPVQTPDKPPHKKGLKTNQTPAKPPLTKGPKINQTPAKPPIKKDANEDDKNISSRTLPKQDVTRNTNIFGNALPVSVDYLKYMK